MRKIRSMRRDLDTWHVELDDEEDDNVPGLATAVPITKEMKDMTEGEQLAHVITEARKHSEPTEGDKKP